MTTEFVSPSELERSSLMLASFNSIRPPALPHFKELIDTFEKSILHTFMDALRRHIASGSTVERKVSCLFPISIQSSAQIMWRVTPCCGDDGKLMNQEKRFKAMYEYVKDVLVNFVKNDITPSVGGGVDLLKQASVCWEIMNEFDRFLGIFFKDLIKFYKEVMKHPNTLELHDLSTAIRREYFFSILKDRLQSYIVDLTNLLRVEDWQGYNSAADSFELFRDDERYKYLYNIKDLFLRIDQSTVVSTNTFPTSFVCCPRKHNLTLSVRATAWSCNARKELGGCKSGDGIHVHIQGSRWRCDPCDFDYCGSCYAAKKDRIPLFSTTNVTAVQGLTSYVESIETPFLSSLSAFYSKKIDVWKTLAVTNTAANADSYLRFCIAALKLERARARRYLDKSTFPKIDLALINQFVSSNLSNLESNLTAVFEDLFSFERYAKSEADCYAVSHVMNTARESFEMLSEFDKSVNNTSFCSKIADIIYASVIRNFSMLIERTAPVTQINKEELIKFYLSFFRVYECYQNMFNSLVFNNHTLVSLKAREAYAKVVNRKDSYFGKSFGETMAMFLDCLLSSGKSRALIISETSTFDSIMTKSLKISSFIDDKLTLFQCLQNHLFYRITEANFESLDNERLFVGMLTQQFGLSSSVKLSGLINSVSESINFSQNFIETAARAEIANDEAVSIPIFPLVLSRDYFARQRQIDIGACPSFAPFERAFKGLQKTFADVNASNVAKILVASFTSGSCVLSCTFFPPATIINAKLPPSSPNDEIISSSSRLISKPRTYIITTGVLQAYVLMTFTPRISGQFVDENGFITFERIKELTRLVESGAGDTEKELSRIILTLYRGPNKLLLAKLSPGVDDKTLGVRYSPTCKFKANPDFVNKLSKFSIPLLRYEQSEKREQKELKDNVNLLVDAAINRIMKIRKTLSSRELSLEVKVQLADRYQLTDRELTRRFDHAIEQGWISRDEEKQDNFIHIA